jgi:integrase
VSALKIQDELRRDVPMYRIVFTHPETGKRTNRRWKSREEAEAFLTVVDGFGLAAALAADATRPERARPTAATGSAVPFGEYAAEHLRRRRMTKRGARPLKAKTLEAYGHRLSIVKSSPLAALPMRQIKPDHVEAFVVHMATTPGVGGKILSTRTRDQALSFVKSVTADAHVRGDIPSDPARVVDRIPLGDDAHEPTILKAWEFAAIMAHVPEESRPFFRFALESGCRYGELSALTWADVRPDAEEPDVSLVEIVKGKTRKAERTTSVPTDVAASVPMVDDVMLFPAPNKAAYRRVWIKAVQRAQSPMFAAPLGFDPITIEPRIHDLRHTHAVLMLTVGGMNIIALADRLGHSSPDITAAYYARFSKPQIATLGRIAASTMATFLTPAEPVPAR